MFNKENLCKLTPTKIEERSSTLLNQMTLKEKVWLLNGNWYMISNGIRYKNFYNPVPIVTNGLKRLDVSPIKFTDGPRGGGSSWESRPVFRYPWPEEPVSTERWKNEWGM